jgi:putative DNA primase/helicase
MTDLPDRLDDAGRDALRQAAPDIVTALRGPNNARLSTQKNMRWGTRGSLSLIIAGPKEGLWYDHEVEHGGDIVQFIRCELNCSFIEALDYAGRYVPELRSGRTTSRAPPRPAATKAADDDDERRIEQAIAIWCDAKPLPGTIAESYLRSRYIEVPGEALEVLRFHPRCPWLIGTRPAMVALVRDIITNEPIAIHRTALTVDGRKIDRPKLLGPSAGGAIKLFSDIVTGELTIAEGIETTLSAMILGFAPAWSVIDAGGIAKFPALPWISRLTIIADNDKSQTGEKAACECLAAYEAAGLEARSLMPSTPGEDFNDILVALEGRR